MIKKNLALLCDYGLDDAIATVYLLERAEHFGKIDILPVAGNFPLAAAFVNAKRLLTHADHLPGNVRIVDTSAVTQPEEALPEIHGSDGMGDVLPSSYEEKVPVVEYTQWLDQMDDSYVIVSLGPCTVTQDILEKKGALPLVMMAGNVSEPPNYNGYEFNHGMDPAAFAACVQYPHVCATLDTCHVPQCDLMRHRPPETGVFGKLLSRCLELSRGRGESLCSAYDLTATVYLVYPERFEVRQTTDPQGNRVSMLYYAATETVLEDSPETL